MALKVGELFATLGLDGKGFYKGLDKAETSLSNLSKKMAMTGAGLTLGLTAPLVKLGKEVFSAAADYESAFAGVRKTTDATEAEYAQLSKGIIDMSKQLPMAATGIAGVAEVAGQLGIEKENLLDFTKIMIDLGESTDLTATDAATAFAKIAAVTGMTADEYSRLGSAVVGLGNSFPTTESAITEIMQRIAGTSAVVGVSEADMAGFATAISAIGMEAQAGGSSFSIFASDMSSAVSKGGKGLKGFAKVAGMSAKDFKKMFKEDAAGAIQAFVEGLGKTKDPLKTLSDMGLKDVNLQRMLLGLANGGDLLGNALDTANTEWEKNTALSDEAKKRYATMDSQLAMMKNSVTELGMEFGTALAPYVMAASDAIKSITDAFKTMSPEAKDTIIKIALVAAAIGPVTAALGGMFKGLSSVFGVMKFAMGPLGLIAGGLFVLYKLSPKLRAAFGKLGKFFGDFFARIKNGRKPLVALRQSFINVFGKDAYNSIVGVLDKMGKAWESTVGWFADTGKGLTDAWGKGSAEGGFFGGLAESAKYLFPRLKDAFQAGWETVSGAAKTLGSKAMTALGTSLLGTEYEGLGKKLIEAALALQEGETIDLAGLAKAGVEALYTAFTGDTLEYSKIGSAIWTKLTDAAWTIPDLSGKAGEFTGALGAAIGKKLGEVDTTGLSGADNMALAVMKAFLESKVWEADNIGMFFSGLVAGGVKDKFDAAPTAEGIWTKIRHKFLTDSANGILAAQAWLRTFGQGIVDAPANFAAGAARILKDIGAAIQSLGQWFQGLGGWILDQIMAGLLSFDLDIQKRINELFTHLGLEEPFKIPVTLEPTGGFTPGGGTTGTGGGDTSGTTGGGRGAILPSILPTPADTQSEIDKMRNLISQGLVDVPNDAVKPQLEKVISEIPTMLQQGVDIPSALAKQLSGIDWSAVDIGVDMASLLENGLTPEESSTALQAISDYLKQGFDAATKDASASGAGATAAFSAGMTSDTSGITTAGNTVGTSALTGVTDKLTDTVVKGLGTDFAKGIAGGIKDSTYLITAASTAAATAAMNAIKNALGIHSPSKVGINLGGFFGKGFALGIEGMRRTVGMASSGLARFAASGAVPAASRLAYAGAGASGGMNVPIDYNRLARAIEQRPAIFNINDRQFARATTDANAAAQARRQARINAGYGG